MKKTTGEIIKELRNRKGLTQRELSLGICSKQHIYKLEKNKRLPLAYIVKLLSEKLGEELVDMLYKTDYCEWET